MLATLIDIGLTPKYQNTFGRTAYAKKIHPADPLSLTALLPGVHPASLDFVADPAELAVVVVQGKVLVEAAQHHREIMLLLSRLINTDKFFDEQNSLCDLGGEC